ncbi:copper homeostasis protein CutC [Martelella alba]|uniref:PF03932 family protein CutC n=1 Tax=Martelella alba TaxID=2590451 RepID=A0A506UBP3_9HYPH|nr:copper homeostasis protein CutC [Martelella alba]TPW30069.1 copper homeostasis protein CutC [Martelella alba]
MTRPMIEICVEGLEQALAAEEAGAERIELCAALASEGGITPSMGEIRLAVARLSIPVFPIIRPRGGDFCYSDAEFDVILADIAAAKEAGAAGVVTGILTEDGRIDVDRMKKAVAAARPMGVTCHRAFDMARDPLEALDDLIEAGVDRLLSSGQRITAEAGKDILKTMIAHANGGIIIMVCGDPDPQSLFAEGSPVTGIDFHFGATAFFDSPMRYRNPHVSMGKGTEDREYRRVRLDGEAVRAKAKELRDRF